MAILLLGLSIQPLLAQEEIIKGLIEQKRDRKYAFYPSTLRMVNIGQNEDYNEMVSGVEKLLIYTLDSATQADKSYRAIADAYLNEGFEEYAMAFGGELSMAILGKESGTSSQYAGYFAQDELAVAFYLRGNIAWQKIPTLLSTMRKDDFFNLLDTNTKHP